MNLKELEREAKYWFISMLIAVVIFGIIAFIIN